jgi:hypothetical protein
MQFKTTLLWLVIFTLVIQGCKKWDDHTKITDENLTVNLLDEINNRPNLSKFSEYLQKTGLDNEISSSKTYTVWAPTNDALQNLDPAIVSDVNRLKQFISNHIAFQSFFTGNAKTPIRVPMLNGKQVSFSSTKFDEANIVEADKYVKNGALHIIDKPAPVLPNGWEFISTVNYNQNTFILSLTSTFQDPALAVIDSISSVTGLPVYRPGTGIVTRNSFTTGVYDLKKEDKLYTYFILNDTAFNSEVNKIKIYFNTSTADSTTNLSSYAVVKDLAVEGLYTIDQLPDTLISKFGVKIPINKNKIVETRRLSNGIAYVMSQINFAPKNKIPTVIIQGESPRGFFRPTGEAVDVRNTTFYRVLANPSTGQLFNDIFVYNHGIANLNILYQASNLSSVKYKIYWVAVNDTIVVSTLNPGVRVPVSFSQRLAMGTRTATNFATISIAPRIYSETYLGDYIQTTYGTLDMFLTAGNSTTTGANTLTLDYIKLVPDIQ